MDSLKNWLMEFHFANLVAIAANTYKMVNVWPAELLAPPAQMRTLASLVNQRSSSLKAPASKNAKMVNMVIPILRNVQPVTQIVLHVTT